MCKGIRERLNKLRNILHSWFVNFNNVRMAICFKTICRFNAFLIKIPTRYSWQMVSKLC